MKLSDRIVPHRSEMREGDTWDLSPLFKSDSAWKKTLRKLEMELAGFDAFRGRLKSSAQVLHDCLRFWVDFERSLERVGSYAFLKASEDLSNSVYQGMVAEYTRLATRAEEACSYIAPEIQAIPVSKMKDFLKSPLLVDFRFKLEKILRFRSHILSRKEERILAMQGEVVGAPGRIFSQLNDADLKFGEVKDHMGRKVPLTHSSFRSLMESPIRAIRKDAFHKFYRQYEFHANSLAAMLSASVLQDVYFARVRKYKSCLEAALFPDNVPVAVYDNLIEVVRDGLPVLYRYLKMRRDQLGVSQLHMYDTYVPLVAPQKVNVSYDQAVEWVCESLKPLGNEYCRILRDGLTHRRWVDRYENVGKRSGAFSAGGFDGPPYILMNYRPDTWDSVFTLAHEAGHSMHTFFSARHQPFHYYQYEIFVAEVASTLNEQLLTHYLLNQTQDKKLKAFLINKEIDEIRGTLIRQSMFAEFEKRIHDMAEAGEPLTLDAFKAVYRTLLEDFWGKDFYIDEDLTLECLRIPHFYHAFYVYKYATGISAAIYLAKNLIDGGKKSCDSYLKMLCSGGCKYPLELLREAGVDMESPNPIQGALHHFEERVRELHHLLKKMSST